MNRRLAPFLLLAALLAQRSSLPPPAAEFFRAAAPAAAEAGRDWSGGDGRTYVHRARVTFPRGGSGRSIVFTSPMSGRVGITLECWAQQAGSAVLRVAGAAADPAGRLPLRRGRNTLGFSCRTGRGAKVAIQCSCACDFSRPLVYRATAAQRRRLVFLISVDSLAAGHMGCYGYEGLTTPRIDAFCREALRVERAFAASPWTLPSHMSLFTSLPETAHGVRFTVENELAAVRDGSRPRLRIFALAPALSFLVENLAASLPAFSFNGGGNVAADYGFFRGFDLYQENPDDCLDPLPARRLFRQVRAHLLAQPLPAAFYFLHTYHVHLPYRPSRRALAAIAPGQAPRSFDFQRDLGGIAGIFRPCERRALEEARALYDAEVLDFDNEFGGFIDFLRSRRLYDSSLIVLTSDHGEEFLEHGSWAHGTGLHDTQLRVPLIIKFPGRMHAGRVYAGDASLMDVLPTLLDFLGLPPAVGIRGRSLLDEFRRGPTRGRAIAASLLRCRQWEALPAKAALIQDGFKLIRHLPPGPECGVLFRFPPPRVAGDQLFDLSSDPGETKDVRERERRRYGIMAALLGRELRAAGRRKAAPPLPADASAEALERLRVLGYLR